MLVCKFGGSSLSSQSQFKKVKAIVESEQERQIIVVSALGKRESTDNKLTDLFYVIYSHAEHGICYDTLWQEISSRFIAVRNELGLTFPIEEALDQIKASLENRALSVDELVSRGEYLTARLMAEYLGYEFVDAKDLISFTHNGEVDKSLTKQQVENLLHPQKRYVIPGFYGAYPNGKIKLFGRGGSDISGALIAASVNARLYENFTDVSGVLMADPRIVDNPPAIPHLTYEELSELTYMGANVLHEESAHPVRDVNVPICIKNTNAPQDPGTMITGAIVNEQCNTPKVLGISGKKSFLSIDIYKKHMSTEIGFMERALAILSRFQVNIEHVPTGIDHLSIVVSAESVKQNEETLIEQLKNELAADYVTINDDIALMTVVGRNIVYDAKFLVRVFHALANQNIAISFISQSPKKINIILGVKNADFEKATKALYEGVIA